MRASAVPLLTLTTCAAVVQAASLTAWYDRFSGPKQHDAENQRVLAGTKPSVAATGSQSDNFFAKHYSAHHPRTGFVAFGDSYSAGIGTFVDGKENECRQGNGAYPYLINADLMAADRRTGTEPNTTTSFQWLSCTGSIIDDILSGGSSSQIDTFNVSYGAPDSSPDFATLSIGGNDLGFFDVMNACVFRFYSFYSGTCESALALSDEQINSPQFELRLALVMTEILDKVHWEKRPWFVITVTGYTRFFNDETDECDDESLGVWWGGPKLKREVRQRMNKLVLAVNDKLRKSIDEINRRFVTPKIFFVDYDTEFDGHRFCEPNITEPDYNRTDTWFFLPGGPDHMLLPNQTDGPTTLVAAETLPPSSPLTDPESCLETAEKSGDWGEKALCYMAVACHRDPSLRFAPAYDGITTQNSMWYVPTYYGKTFHPVRYLIFLPATIPFAPFANVPPPLLAFLGPPSHQG